MVLREFLEMFSAGRTLCSIYRIRESRLECLFLEKDKYSIENYIILEDYDLGMEEVKGFGVNNRGVFIFLREELKQPAPERVEISRDELDSFAIRFSALADKVEALIAAVKHDDAFVTDNIDASQHS